MQLVIETPTPSVVEMPSVISFIKTEFKIIENLKNKKLPTIVALFFRALVCNKRTCKAVHC